MSRNRKNDKKCLEMGENENPFSPISRHLLGLEIREKVSRKRRNDNKCLEIRETCPETGETTKIV